MIIKQAQVRAAFLNDRHFQHSLDQACQKAGISARQVREVLDLAINHFDPPDVTKLPEVARELYVERPTKPSGDRENILEFIDRVWRPWIEAGLLTRADLKRLDNKADKAIDNWTQNGHVIPDHLKIPTKKEANDIAISSDPLAALRNPRLARVIASRLYKGIPVPLPK